MNHRAREGVWIQCFLNKILPKQAVKKMKMLNDSKTSLNLTKDPESQNRTNYIDMIYHHLQGLVEERELKIEQISSSSMLANSLKKALSCNDVVMRPRHMIRFSPTSTYGLNPITLVLYLGLSSAAFIWLSPSHLQASYLQPYSIYLDAHLGSHITYLGSTFRPCQLPTLQIYNQIYKSQTSKISQGF